MRMSEYYNLPDFDRNVFNKSKIKHYIEGANGVNS